MNIINHIRIWYNILKNLSPQERNSALLAIDHAIDVYNRPTIDTDDDDELDKMLGSALRAMDDSMKQQPPTITTRNGGSRKHVRKQFKKSKSKYTTRYRQ